MAKYTRYSMSFVSFLAWTSAISQHPFSANFFTKLSLYKKLTSGNSSVRSCSFTNLFALFSIFIFK
uniref:Uncharacterized protein n=1 Tax=Arundo donax TaxID=35708 RepID=A0A0A9EPU9_ARUDO